MQPLVSLLKKVKQLGQSARLSPGHSKKQVSECLAEQKTGLSTAAHAHMAGVPLHQNLCRTHTHTHTHTNIHTTISVTITISRASHSHTLHATKQELLPQSKLEEGAILILSEVTANT